MNVYFFTIVVLLLLLVNLIEVSSSNSWQRFRTKSKRNSSNLWKKFHHHDEEEQLVTPTSSDEEQIDNQRSAVVVLTSLSGIYVWWPKLFGGDDSFRLLLDQEDVPRFHDVTGDQHGNIYLTSPHERTVYQLKFVDGWWIATFSNHSVMNSIRSEMPLFVTIHYVSSILYVYGHSDIQMIDLLERPRTRGSAPFMRRLRELSPNLRISDLIIDQIRSEGYIIGDSYGWCTIIRCSLTVNECVFLFKIPSSYDNRPYPCTGTIDFSRKILYLSLEEKILLIHLNEQTNYDRRSILIEKYGPRSTLGYDDIVVYRNSILYTDVLRPLLHFCPSPMTDSCLNISLEFPSRQISILPLRLSIIEVIQLRPPTFDDDQLNDDKDQTDQIHLNQTTTIPVPLSLIGSNRTRTNSSEQHSHQSFINWSSVAIFILGFSFGSIVAGFIFMFHNICCNRTRPEPEDNTSVQIAQHVTSDHEEEEEKEEEDDDDDHSATLLTPPEITNRLDSTQTSFTYTSETTGVTSSSTSYDPDIVL